MVSIVFLFGIKSAAMIRDNYYETGINSLNKAKAALGPESVAYHQQPVMAHLVDGILRIAQGLLQEQRILEEKLDALAKRLPAQK